MIRKIALGLGLSTICFIAVFAFFIVQWSNELKSKFHAPIDSVPTIVYSRVVPLQRNQGMTVDELKKRLALRKYVDLSTEEGTPLVEQSFRVIESDDRLSTVFEIFLAPFAYPAYFHSSVFNQMYKAAHTGRRFSIIIADNTITQVIQEDDIPVEVEAVGLEPLIVARLNNNSKETREYLRLSEIPHTLLKAIISVEDRRFLGHIGVDFRGILRSIYVNIKKGAYEHGASTITQQLVRNIYLTKAKTIRRKVKEAVMAILMEVHFDKDTILEKYLNEVYFGQLGSLEIHGVSEAAKHYFSKKIDQLSIAEQAVLAGIVRGPYYYSPYRYPERTKKRQEFVLDKMLETNAITHSEYMKAKLEELQFVKITPVLDQVPYFTDYIRAQINQILPEQELLGAGYRVFSTVDLYYQQLAEEAIKNGLDSIEARLAKRLKKSKKNIELDKPLQGVLVAADPVNGEIRAIVGGSSYRETTYNRAIYMKRQVGSVFKPFVYLSGLLYGVGKNGEALNAASKIKDEPFVFEYENKKWRPQNDDRKYSGLVTLRHALANSINIIAAKIVQNVGMEKVIETARNAGVNTEMAAFPSLALGAVDLPVFDVVRSYTTLANWGLKRDLTSILLIVDENQESVVRFIYREEQVLPQAEVANLVDMMQSVFVEGTASSAKNYGFIAPGAGKTGTTNDYRDSWFAGFTNKLITVTWVGFDKDGEVVNQARKVLRLSGSNGAMPVWARFMSGVHRNLPLQDLRYPEGALIRKKIDITAEFGEQGSCEDENVMEEVFTSRNLPEYTCE